MRAILVTVEPWLEEGGCNASWTDPGRGGIVTQGETLEELDATTAEAVGLYVEDLGPASRVRLQFVEGKHYD